jgi:hypothetical protein
LRLQSSERERAAGRRHIARLNVVLERNRNPVQRSAHASRRALAIPFVGFLERARVHVNDGVEPIFVQRDARERLLHELV